MSHDDYTIVLRKEESAGEWARVARVPELPGCAATEETPEAALGHIKESIKAYIEDQKESGREVPPPSARPSGRFTVRVPRWVHRELKLQADAEGISLNQHVAAILSYWASHGAASRTRAHGSSRRIGDVIEFPGGFTLGVDPKEGVLKDELAERPRLQRTALARLIMPAPVARSLARWLDGKAEVLERR